MNPSRLLIEAAMVVDGQGVHASPGAVLMQGERILASGTPQTIGPVGEARTLRLERSVVLPALVNAHCHLDLTHIGPVPYGGDFPAWIDLVRRKRATTDDSIAAAVKEGVRLSRAGGTAMVGDIAGTRSLAPIASLRHTGMPGVSYFEVFGLGKRSNDAIAALNNAVEQCPAFENGVALGLQPHAPYSCDPAVYRAALQFGLPLATHLAETLDELEFVSDACGPIADFIKRIGVWDDTINGSNKHPIDHLAGVLRESPWVAVHLNYIEDCHLQTLSELPITVAYCPRASAYFGHPHKGHPAHQYRQMLDAGINVALGTDSILCLDTPDRISVLDEMRLLHQRDAVNPQTLLRLGTVNGATALGFDPALVTLAPGPSAGLLAVPIDPASRAAPLQQLMMNNNAPEWIAGPFVASESWRVTHAHA